MFLSHSTSATNIESIINDGFIYTHFEVMKKHGKVDWFQSTPSVEPDVRYVDDWFVHWTNGVYFGIGQDAPMNSILLPSVILRSRIDWFANSFDNFGLITDGTIFGLAELARKNFLKDSPSGEIVFLSRVSLDNAVVLTEDERLRELCERRRIPVTDTTKGVVFGSQPITWRGFPSAPTRERMADPAIRKGILKAMMTQ